ncbi:Protein phosphatase methylesterase 1 [Glutinoglossum americanum]|uniref:Protein phosphatase methylesterase 1 n=1 Tax=Glutinoglossum americanum TaxID=1670608 RepID=A0A9P8I1R5_9PEZI|nr:Protein phosphatase methylesterase 1 [Glutinoglossum americanum]
MSDLQRSFLKAKLAHLPSLPPEDVMEAPPEVDYDDSSSSASSASSTGTIKPLQSKNLFARPIGFVEKLISFSEIKNAGASRNGQLERIPWSSYFSQELYLQNPSVDGKPAITHHVYVTPPASKGPLFVTHHGAGSSGLSFAVLASEIRKLLPQAGVLSPDARGHGETVVSTPEDGGSTTLDLSLDMLSNDMIDIIRLTQAKLGWKEIPPLVLVGHSLGGAVVTDVANRGVFGDKVLAYAVLDVVEGSAIDALQSMQTYLSTRPLGFHTQASGIEWHIRSRTIRNSTSARIAVPALLRHNPSPQTPSRTWVWRTDLAKTQPFWEGWFIGLSKKFLESKGGKLLLLAGTDRLDKELTIGQMQGKYQLQVFLEAGHFIHEDLPEKTAVTLVDFYKRNDRSALVLPPKVADLLKSSRERSLGL